MPSRITNQATTNVRKMTDTVAKLASKAKCTLPSGASCNMLSDQVDKTEFWVTAVAIILSTVGIFTWGWKLVTDPEKTKLMEGDPSWAPSSWAFVILSAVFMAAQTAVIYSMLNSTKMSMMMFYFHILATAFLPAYFMYAHVDKEEHTAAWWLLTLMIAYLFWMMWVAWGVDRFMSLLLVLCVIWWGLAWYLFYNRGYTFTVCTATSA